MASKNQANENDEQILLTFLERTKEGYYAPVDPDVLSSNRANMLTDEPYIEEEAYYYSTR